MVRTIVTSATYRQRSTATPELLAVDPYNRQLARQSVFRMVDVPLLIRPGVDDAALRVYREGEEYDELLRGRAYVQMLLHVQQRGDTVTTAALPAEVSAAIAQLQAAGAGLAAATPGSRRLELRGSSRAP